MTYLSKQNYTPPPYAEMAARNALMTGTTEARYEASVRNLAGLEGFDVSAITYASDGLRVTGMEVLPSDLAAGEKMPLMIYNRGGSGDYGMLTPGQVMVLMAPFAGRLRCGVLASNYRGNGDSEGREEFGGADVNDVLNLLNIGRAQEWWDGKHIFMLGWSRGGMMTYRAIAEGAPITAAAVGAGVADLVSTQATRANMDRVFKRFIPDYPDHAEDAFEQRSAIHWPEKLNVPLLLMHGDADDIVLAQQSRDLHQKMEALGKQVKYVEYAGGDHALKRHVGQWHREVGEWFEAYRK
jgi:dipeptidyl aminopeptidase/acylaminoacyl peptidase